MCTGSGRVLVHVFLLGVKEEEGQDREMVDAESSSSDDESEVEVDMEYEARRVEADEMYAEEDDTEDGPAGKG